MIIHNGNKHTLRATINHLASLGVSSIKTAYASNVGEWTTHSDNKSIGIKDVFQTYLDYIPQYYSDNMPMDIFFTSFFAADRETPDKYQILCYDESYNPEKILLCPLSRSSANISPEGRVVMCGMMYGTESEKIFPAMPETHFSECINYPEHMKLCDMRASDFLKANEECRTCKFTRHCYGGCRGPALIEQNNLMATNKDLCELFYGGWIKKIVDAVKQARPSAESPVKDSLMLQ
ncbi:MAG: SPASM domain-containing protein [Synergistaceae bacterium]|nr:SPASM domain-containing protein [Synergistaceae bacterium]